MKKYFLLMLVFVALVELPSFGQLSPRAAFDYFPGGFNTKYTISLPDYYGGQEVGLEVPRGKFRVRIGANYAFGKYFTAYFDQATYMEKVQGLSFQPLQSEWYIGVKVKVYKGITFSIEHLCIHPVVSDGSYQVQVRQYGGYNMFSISYGY